MKSIFSLLIMFALFTPMMSFGSATPDGDKIEKVFVKNSDVSDIAVVAVVDVVFDVSNEIVKVAPVDCGSFALESKDAYLFSFDIKPVTRTGKENYNYLQNPTVTPFNLPLKVGWHN